MDIVRNLSESFDFTKRLVDELGDLALLIVISALPILNFVTLGYCAKVIREAPEALKPPKLKGFVRLWFLSLIHI